MEVAECLINRVKSGGIELISSVLHFEQNKWFLIAAKDHHSIFTHTLRDIDHFSEMILDFLYSDELHLALINIQSLLV